MPTEWETQLAALADAVREKRDGPPTRATYAGPSNVGAGLLEPGNILNLYNRPQTAKATGIDPGVAGPPGSRSTTLSSSWNAQEFGPEVVAKYGKNAEILVPTVVGGKFLTGQEARDRFMKTGQHLGVFKDVPSAEKYAQALHESQQALGQFYGATSESKPERQVDVRFQTQLAVMLGHARTTPAPIELGTATQLGDPTKIVPPSFPRARGSKLEWYSTEDLREGGEYEPSTRTIRINDVQKQIEEARKKYPPGTKLQADTWDPRSVMYMPSTLPHEEGHAIWDELETRAFRQLDADQPDIKEALKQGGEALDLMRDWHGLHDKFLKNNKALGPYQYADDHSHSFADAFAAWMVDPAKFKNLFPEMDTYFQKLAKTK